MYIQNICIICICIRKSWHWEMTFFTHWFSYQQLWFAMVVLEAGEKYQMFLDVSGDHRKTKFNECDTNVTNITHVNMYNEKMFVLNHEQHHEDVLWIKKQAATSWNFFRRFPEIGLPLNHPCLVGISLINHPFGVPHLWKLLLKPAPPGDSQTRWLVVGFVTRSLANRRTLWSIVKVGM